MVRAKRPHVVGDLTDTEYEGEKEKLEAQIEAENRKIGTPSMDTGALIKKQKMPAQLSPAQSYLCPQGSLRAQYHIMAPCESKVD